MIFERLIIENLFCYYGRQEFDLTPGNDDRNVVLIHGRNGQGKTSLLNCIKLLFGDATEDLRINATPGRTLGHKQYVLGYGNEWQGILNRRAVAQNASSYSIQAVLLEGKQRLLVKRQWNLSGDSHLSIKQGTTTITGSDADEKLFELMPSYSIPFFFFDGELVQRVAARDDEERLKAMQSLLDIKPIQRLGEDVVKLRKEWTLEAADQDARLRLLELQKNLEIEQAKHAQDEQRVETLRQQISESEREIGTIRAKVEAFESRGFDEDRGRIQGEKKALDDKLDELRSNIFERAFPLAPLLLCSDLVEKTQIAFASAQDTTNAQAELVLSLKENLPRRVFDEPPHSAPPLTPTQLHHYKTRLLKSLESYIPEPSPGDIYQAGPATRRLILEQLKGHGQRDGLRDSLFSNLQTVIKTQARIRELQIRLNQAADISDDERRIWSDLRTKNEELNRELGALKVHLEQLTMQRKGKQDKIRALERDVAQAVEDVERKSKAREKLTLARNVEELLEELIQAIRESRRQSLESRLNSYFARLFDSNRLIRRIGVESDFTLRSYDAHGRTVKRSSISAGMQQLLAISLLWALKDLSNRRMPVVIDTPLARLDRQHQQNILQDYFPHVAEQVIILPTNSELDRTKYDLLRKHVYKEYELKNREGDHTEAEPDSSMYPQSSRRS